MPQLFWTEAQVSLRKKLPIQPQDRGRGTHMNMMLKKILPWNTSWCLKCHAIYFHILYSMQLEKLKGIGHVSSRWGGHSWTGSCWITPMQRYLESLSIFSPIWFPHQRGKTCFFSQNESQQQNQVHNFLLHLVQLCMQTTDNGENRTQWLNSCTMESYVPRHLFLADGTTPESDTC